MRFDEAIALYQSGDRASAKAGAESILAAPSDRHQHGDALNLLAVIAQDEGRH